MATKVNDVMTVMASGAVQSIKSQKEQKVTQAFNSYLDSVTRGSSSVTQNGANSFDNNQTVKKDAANNQTSDNSLNSDRQKSINDAKNSSRAGQKTNESGSKTGAAQAEQMLEDDQMTTDQNATLLEAVSAMIGVTPEQLDMALQQFDMQIKEIVADGLGISVESLEQLMQQLNLSAADLLDSNNLMNVLMQSNGLEDVSAVLTNEALFNQFKEINQELSFAVNDFAQEQSIPTEQLHQLLQAESKAPQITVTAESAPQIEAAVQPQVQEESVRPTAQSADSQVTAQETEVSQFAVTNDKQKFTQHDSADSEQHFNHNAAAGTQTAQQIISNIADAVSTETVYASADMEDIVNQIVEQIKLQFNADSTSMEMQLNPESLGKVQLHVIVKDGAVTAQMAVENEAVKHALESQMVTLRENMNNQGVKVEAIEVTIASHEFERNLQQENNANQQAFEQEQAAAARKRVNLNLDAMQEEDLQEMTEAESLERKIMMESGNRISFQA